MLPLIHKWRLLTCNTIGNGSNSTVWGSGYSAHQAVGKFGNTTLIWSVAFIANARLEMVYMGTLIRRLNVSL